MHYKQNNKESKTYVQGLRPFGNTLPRGIKGVLKKSGYNYSEIISKWKRLVGKEISDCCYPKSIKIGKNNVNGTLLIAVKRGDEINVEYSKKKIINKVNSYFGYQLINNIKLQAINSGKAKAGKKNINSNFSKNFEKKIKEIKNENLKNSLNDLYKVIKND
tara:strand:- start:955 stop:1437 length:483 start_codon:yes stop_codon:yes gene_type:complete